VRSKWYVLASSVWELSRDVGAFSSRAFNSMYSVFRQHGLLVAVSATSSNFSSNADYEVALQMASDVQQTAAILEALRNWNWPLFCVVYNSSSMYPLSLFNALSSQQALSSQYASWPFDISGRSVASMASFFSRLKSQGAAVYVVLLDASDICGVVDAALSVGVFGNGTQWVGTDSWNEAVSRCCVSFLGWQPHILVALCPQLVCTNPGSSVPAIRGALKGSLFTFPGRGPLETVAKFIEACNGIKNQTAAALTAPNVAAALATVFPSIPITVALQQALQTAVTQPDFQTSAVG
jgi:hypothetical protein